MPTLPMPSWVHTGPLSNWSSSAQCASCDNTIKDAWNNSHTCHGCLKKIHKSSDCYNLWYFPWVVNLDLYEPEKLTNPDKLCHNCKQSANLTATTLHTIGINYLEPGAKDKYRAYTESRAQGVLGTTSSSQLWGKLDMQDNAFVVAVKRVMDAIFPGNRSWRVLLNMNSKSSSQTNLKSREITLPNIWKHPLALGQSQEVILDTMTGMAIHETGHAQYSDLATAKLVHQISRDKGYSEKAAQAIQNVVEDYFLERKIKDRFPAFGSYFRHSYTWTLETTRKDLVDLLSQPGAEDLFGVRIAAATWEILCPGELGRNGMQMPQKLQDLIQQCREILAERFNSEYMEDHKNRAKVTIELYELLQTKELECTQECKATQRQWRKIRNGDALPTPGATEFDADCPVHGENNKELQLISSLAKGDTGNQGQTIAARKQQEESATCREDIIKQNTAYVPQHRQRIQRLSKVIEGMRKVLQLRNTQAANQRKNLRAGKLTRRSISRLSTMHATNVFHTKLPEQYPKVRIGFLVDESGSMGGSINAARDACVSIHEAAKQIKGVKTWSWGFSTGGGSYSARIRRYASPSDRSIPSIEMPMLNGGTPTGPCMEKVAEILTSGATSDEKIYCFVITDGYADSTPTPGEIVNAYPQVTFVHVGIGGVRDQAIPNYVGPVERAEQLPPLMMDTVLAVLQR